MIKVPFFFHFCKIGNILYLQIESILHNDVLFKLNSHYVYTTFQWQFIPHKSVEP